MSRYFGLEIVVIDPPLTFCCVVRLPMGVVQGTATYPDGTKYEGDFKDGAMHGQVCLCGVCMCHGNRETGDPFSSRGLSVRCTLPLSRLRRKFNHNSLAINLHKY